MLTVRIKTDNAAFADALGVELADILRGLADDVEHFEHGDGGNGSLRDSNGNTVGNWTLSR